MLLLAGLVFVAGGLAVVAQAISSQHTRKGNIGGATGGATTGSASSGAAAAAGRAPSGPASGGASSGAAAGEAISLQTAAASQLLSTPPTGKRKSCVPRQRADGAPSESTPCTILRTVGSATARIQPRNAQGYHLSSSAAGATTYMSLATGA